MIGQRDSGGADAHSFLVLQDTESEPVLHPWSETLTGDEGDGWGCGGVQCICGVYGLSSVTTVTKDVRSSGSKTCSCLSGQ